MCGVGVLVYVSGVGAAVFNSTATRRDSEKVVNSKQNSQDAPRGSFVTRPKC